jgi:diguanylate cyclase
MTAPHTTASPAEAAPQGTHTFLSSRLVVTGILAAGLALLTVVVALTGVDYWSSRASMLQDSRVEAAIVADNISAAVMFRDNTAANEMLGALRSSSMVISATVYDEDGVLFAHYARMPDPGLPTTLQAVGLNGATERADWRMLEIARPIEVSAKGWGTLYIRKSMEALYTRLALRFGSALLIAACVMALATAMVLRSRAAVREAEDRLHTLAHTDAVTGMGNRHAFNERLAAELDRARSMHQRVALVYIDLDNFKTLNDTFGHAAGDGLLRQVARRLQSVVRGTDTIARLGG